MAGWIIWESEKKLSQDSFKLEKGLARYSPSSLFPFFSPVKGVAQAIKQLDPLPGEHGSVSSGILGNAKAVTFLPSSCSDISMLYLLILRSHRAKGVGISFLHREASFHLLSLSLIKGIIFLVLFL